MEMTERAKRLSRLEMEKAVALKSENSLIVIVLDDLTPGDNENHQINGLCFTYQVICPFKTDYP